MSEPSDYYVARKHRLLRQFDTLVKYVYPVLLEHYRAENVEGMIAETRREYESLIPQLPYIGGTQPFTAFILFTAMYLAVYRVNRVHGMGVEDTGELLYEIGNKLLHSFPSFLTYYFGFMNFSRFYLKRLKKRAGESHSRKYPDGYVYNFIEGDGKTFDYGVDYLECASCKFLTRQGAPELAPYLCPADILYSEAMGWGLMRTMTLAEGADKCDFRFKKGGLTKVSVPAAMQAVVARNRQP